MSNTGTFIVPTCKRPEYNLLSPYDTDLKTEFERVETTNFTNDTSISCTAECSTDLKSLGYTQALYNCALCMGLNSTDISTVAKPQLASSWGCSSCYDVVAPIGYYNNTVSNTTTVSPDDITKYFTDASYRSSVDTSWSNATQLDKGATVRNYCVENPSFTITAPAQPVSPQGGGGSGSNVVIIIGIIMGVVLLLCFIGFFCYEHFSKKYKVHKKAELSKKDEYYVQAKELSDNCNDFKSDDETKFVDLLKKIKPNEHKDSWKVLRPCLKSKYKDITNKNPDFVLDKKLADVYINQQNRYTKKSSLDEPDSFLADPLSHHI